jgi:DNA excision repair protein ERCC-4
VKLERGALETGDLALSTLPDGAVVERKTVNDLLACIGRERERFERELKRGRYVGRFMVIVEGTLADVLEQARGVHINAIIGTLAAWQRRYAPFCFAGNVAPAARVAEAFLCGQAREIARLARTTI